MNKTSVDENIEVNSLFEIVMYLGSKIAKYVKLFLNLLLNAGGVFLHFIKRNFLYLLIGGILGGGVGIYKVVVGGPVYESQFSIHLNYSLNKDVYTKTEYLANLVSHSNLDELSEVLKVSVNDLEFLSSIKIEPFVNQNAKIKLYEQYLSLADTLYQSPLSLDDYISNLEPYEFDSHTIFMVSKGGKSDFITIQKGIKAYYSNSDFFEGIKNEDFNRFNSEIAMREQVIETLDSVLKIDNYVKLHQKNDIQSSQNQFLLGDNNNDYNSNWIFDKVNSNYQNMQSIKNKMFNKKELISLTQGAHNGVEKSKIKIAIPFFLFGAGLIFMILVFYEIARFFFKMK